MLVRAGEHARRQLVGLVPGHGGGGADGGDVAGRAVGDALPPAALILLVVEGIV